MAKHLVLFNSLYGTCTASAWLVKKANPTSTLIDIKGVSAANQLTKIALLTDGDYSKVWIFASITEAGGNGVVSWAVKARAFDKLASASRGTLVVSGTPQGNASTTDQILEAGTADIITAGMMHTVTSATATHYTAADKTRYIKTWTAGTVTIVVSPGVTGNWNANDIYSIYNTSTSIVNYFSTSGGKSITQQVWEALYGSVFTPLWIHYMRDWLGSPAENSDWEFANSAPGYKFAYHYGIAEAGGTSSTLPLEVDGGTGLPIQRTGGKASTADMAITNFFAGKYVYVIAGAGIGHSSKITSSTAAGVLTLETPLKPYLAGGAVVSAFANTSVYVVVDDVLDCFRDVAITAFFKYCVQPVVDANYVASFGREITFIDWIGTKNFGTIYDMPNKLSADSVIDRITDNTGKLNTLTGATKTDQDFRFLWNNVIPMGLGAFIQSRNVTSITL